MRYKPVVPITAEKSDPAEQRINACRAMPFVPYTAAQVVLERMEALLAHPQVIRMPGMLLTADPNNGKSAILHEFVTRHPPTYGDPDAEADHVPVVHTECPERPNAQYFYADLLRGLYPSARIGTDVAVLRNRILAICPRVGTRMVLIDEVHDTLNGRETERDAQLASIKKLHNLLKVSVVLAGTKRARSALLPDPQYASRFPEFELPLWEKGPALQSLLGSIEMRLPLRKKYDLWQPEISERILGMTDRTIGGIFTVVTAAAIVGIETGTEVITETELSSLTWALADRDERSAAVFADAEKKRLARKRKERSSE